MAMSLKPPKKGDLKKFWLKPRRDTPKKIQPEYHLITTEGISTEPAYFQGVKNTINSKYRGRVQLDIIGIGDNTLNLLQKVKQKVAKSSNIYKQELLCRGWFPPPNTYDCGSFVVNGTAVVGKEQNNPYNRCKSTQKGADSYEISI